MRRVKMWSLVLAVVAGSVAVHGDRATLDPELVLSPLEQVDVTGPTRPTWDGGVGCS